MLGKIIAFIFGSIIGSFLNVCIHRMPQNESVVWPRSPLVELISALAFVFFFSRYGLSYDFFVYTLFACLLIIATFIDIKHRIIPDEISVGGLIAGFILSSIRGINLSPLSFS